MKTMKCLELPHAVAAYRCPVNGLSDVYQWRTGSRIPEYLLMDSRLGCKLISVPGTTASPLVFLSEGGIGRSEYLFWKDRLGYDLIEGTDRPFSETMKELYQLIDNGIPVILFGLDMYHLPYHKQFYHKLHIPGHVNLMVGYDCELVYLHDNDRNGIQSISHADLEMAWADGYMGFSKKNTYFGIDMKTPDQDVSGLLAAAFRETAAAFLDPVTEFTGEKGYQQLVRHLEEWAAQGADDKLKAVCMHLVTFTASTIPEPPKKLLYYNNGVVNPHRACRDTFASALRQSCDKYGNERWLTAAAYFEKSGALIEHATALITDAILAGHYGSLSKCVPVFHRIRDIEMEAFGQFI